MTASAPAKSPRQAWLEAYERRTSPWLSGLALVFLFTFSVQSIWPDIHQPWFIAMTWFGTGLWVLFVADLLLRLSCAERKVAFLRRNWLDTITVAVPQLRALRVLRIFTKDGILSHGRGIISSGAVTTAVLGTLLIVWIGSLTVLDAERHSPNAEIKTVGEALWWSFETISTVGYGDFVPVTAQGRGIAVLVMFLGISVLGVISASMAATLVKQGAAPPNPAAEVLAELQELKAMVGALQQQLAVHGSVVPSAADATTNVGSVGGTTA